MNHRVVRAALHAVWVWGLLAWGYVSVSVLDPLTAGYQTKDLSVYVPIPTDLFGVAAFAISFFAFIAWEATKT